MNDLVLDSKNLLDTVDTLSQFKYSSKVFMHKYLKQFFVVLFANLAMLVLLTVDGYMASNYVGVDALNSVNLIQPFVLVIGAISSLGASGASIVLPKAFGTGSRSEIKANLKAIVFLTIIFLIGISFIQMPILYTMISIYSVDNAIRSTMEIYAIGIIIANSISIINTTGSYVFIASGHVKELLYLSIFESLSNVLLDIFFIRVCHQGILGAGLGTAVSCTLRAVATIIIFQKIFKVFPLEKVSCKNEMKAIISSGIPIMLTMLLGSLSSFIISAIITNYGGMEAITVISICGIGGSTASIITNSFVQSGSPMIGIFIGNEDYKVAKDIGKKIFIFGAITVTIFVLIIITFSQILYRFYNINDINEWQLKSIRFYMLKYITFSMSSFLINMCVLCGKKKIIIIVNILEMILLIVAILLCYRYFTDFVFLSYVFSGFVSVFILLIVVYKETNKFLNTKKYFSRIRFNFMASKSIDISKKLHKYLREIDLPKSIAYKLALVCEELGFYSKNKSKKKDPQIFLSVKIYADFILVFYLDDNVPTILNKKLTATDLVIGNYNLIESLSSEYMYQNISGMNNFIIKFKI